MTNPTAEDVIAACRRRADARAHAYHEERYQLINGQYTAHNAPSGRIAELRLLMELHEFLLYRALNDTSISLTIPHRPRSHHHAAAIADHILSVDLVGLLGYPRGTTGRITAHTAHTYVLEWGQL